MANHASAQTRIRRNARRAVINGARRSRIRTFIKKVELALTAGNTKEAEEALKAAQPEIQRCCKRHPSQKYSRQKNFPAVCSDQSEQSLKQEFKGTTRSCLFFYFR